MSRQNLGFNNTSSFLSALSRRISVVETDIGVLERSVGNNLVTNASTGATGVGTSDATSKLHVKSATTRTDIGSVSVVVGADAFQADTVTMRGDVTNDLNNQYWFLWSAKNATTYVVWYNVQSNGVDPNPSVVGAVGPATSIMVAIPTDETAINVAIATAAAINAVVGFTVPVPSTSTLIITRTATGWASAPVDGTIGGLWATLQTIPGVSAMDVVGTGTSFTTSYLDGDAIKIDSAIYTITKIINNTRLVLDREVPVSVTSVAYFKDIGLFSVETGGGASKFLVDRSGRVGIGRTPVARILEVEDKSPSIRLYDTQSNDLDTVSGVVEWCDSSSDTVAGYIGFPNITDASFTIDNRATNGYLTFLTNSAERMRVTNTGAISIGTTSPAATALVDVTSTTMGVKFPVMTTLQKNAIANTAGLVVFDSDLAKLAVNTGTGWETITSA